MIIGAPIKLVEDLSVIKSLGFDFGEVLIFNSRSRRLWWESGITNNRDEFLLVAHGPLEDSCDDIRSLRDHYLPNLKATVDTAGRMGIGLLTVHLSVNKLVSNPLLVEKQKALRELVDYGRKSNVLIGLENVSESAEDLESVLSAVPGLGITLDVGHANLVGSRVPFEIIRRLRNSLRHVHLHDNDGREDLHLTIGEGIIDFPGIVRELADSAYGGTLTLELSIPGLTLARNRLQSLLEEITI